MGTTLLKHELVRQLVDGWISSPTFGGAIACDRPRSPNMPTSATGLLAMLNARESR